VCGPSSCESSVPETQCFLPLLRVTLTLALCLRCLPAFGFCEITCPFFTFEEKACLTVPSLQWCDLSERFAAFRLLPFSFGTTHFFAGGGGFCEKVAVTAVALFMVTVHVPVPEQPPPDQPPNVEMLLGVAVRVTDVPYAKACEQVAPQSIPAGELVTEPMPSPAVETVRVWSGGAV